MRLGGGGGLHGGFCPGGFVSGVLSGGFVQGGLSRGVLSGGFCQGGFVRGVLSGEVLSRGFVRGFCPGGFVRGVLSGGFCPGGFCPVGFVRGDLSGGFVRGVLSCWGVLSRGVLSTGRFCSSGGFVQRGIVRGFLPVFFSGGGGCPRITKLCKVVEEALKTHKNAKSDKYIAFFNRNITLI